jgi:hypothetical protein
MPREGVRKEQRSFTDEEVGKILSAAPEPPASCQIRDEGLNGLRVYLSQRKTSQLRKDVRTQV